MKARAPVTVGGFTLVEIMIVVTLIGVLAALAVPTYRRIVARSQDRAVLNNARQLAAAVNQYYMANGVTTAAFTDVVKSDGYLRSISAVAAETYPATFRADTTIVITVIGGARTITYDY